MQIELSTTNLLFFGLLSVILSPFIQIILIFLTISLYELSNAIFYQPFFNYVLLVILGAAISTLVVI